MNRVTDATQERMRQIRQMWADGHSPDEIRAELGLTEANYAKLAQRIRASDAAGASGGGRVFGHIVGAGLSWGCDLADRETARAFHLALARRRGFHGEVREEVVL